MPKREEEEVPMMTEPALAGFENRTVMSTKETGSLY